MRLRYRTLYRLGLTPWDSARMPAPLIETINANRPTGVANAVDLGCGTGRQALHLAEHGWSVTAVDYLAEPIEAARRHDRNGRVEWRVADVTEPTAVDPSGQLTSTVLLILDNGCLHGIARERRAGWATTVNAIAARQCVLLVRAMPRRRRGIGPAGIDEDEVTSLLGGTWRHEPSPAPGWHRYTREETGCG